MAAKRKGSSRFASQAAEDALVRFGPQTDALRSLIDDAKTRYATAATAASANAVSTQAANRAALPVLQGIYTQEAANDAAQRGALSQGSGVIEAAMRREGAAAQSNVVNAIPQAEAGKAMALRLAQAGLTSDLGKIDAQSLALAAQKGAFSSAEIDKLAQAAADRQTKLTVAQGNNKTSRLNALTGAATSTANNKRTTTTSAQNTKDRIQAAKDKEAAKKAGLLPGGVKPLATSQQNSFASSVATTRSEIADFVKGAQKQGKGRGWINAQIAQGIPGYTVHDPSTGKVKIDANGAPVTQPGLKAVSQELVRNVVLDQILYGGPTAITARKLHRAGYKVGAFGAIVPQAKIQAGAKRRRVENMPVHLHGPSFGG